MGTRRLGLRIANQLTLTILLIGTCTAAAEAGAPADCPVTLPEHWPNKSMPWAQQESEDALFRWYGGDNLTALLPVDGVWRGMGPERNYRNKFWWWRAGYSVREEPQPDLVVSALRLDGPAPPIEDQSASHAYGPGWEAMLIGMEFPTSGCWEVRGTYQGAQQLIVVVYVPG